MIERGDGLIANVTSGVAWMEPKAAAGEGGWGLGYAISKGALHRVAGVLHAELTGSGVACVNVEPGYVATERIAQDMAHFGYDAAAGAPPDAIGAAVAWLATGDRAREWSGKVFPAPGRLRASTLVAGLRAGRVVPVSSRYGDGRATGFSCVAGTRAPRHVACRSDIRRLPARRDATAWPHVDDRERRRPHCRVRAVSGLPHRRSTPADGWNGRDGRRRTRAGGRSEARRCECKLQDRHRLGRVLAAVEQHRRIRIAVHGDDLGHDVGRTRRRDRRLDHGHAREAIRLVADQEADERRPRRMASGVRCVWRRRTAMFEVRDERESTNAWSSACEPLAAGDEVPRARVRRAIGVTTMNPRGGPSRSERCRRSIASSLDATRGTPSASAARANRRRPLGTTRRYVRPSNEYDDYDGGAIRATASTRASPW